MEKTLETKYGTFKVSPYINSDEDAVLKLWQLAFKNKIDKRIWRWKFHNNPFGYEMMLCVDASNNPIVLYAGIPYPAQWGKKEIVMTQLIDNMSHPDYRHAVSGRKGLFLQTAEHFFSVFGNPKKNSIHYGFPGIKNFKLCKMFLNGKKISQNNFYFELSIENFKRNYYSIFKKVKIINIFDIEFDKLWELNKKDYPYSVIRNAKFLNWRFSQHPTNRYHSYGLFNAKNKLLGYIIFLLDGDLATIVDIFSKKNKNTTNHLIRKSIGKLIRRKIKKVRIWIPDHHFITMAIIDSGFKPQNEPRGIVPQYRNLSENISLNNFNKFFYTMADGDLF